MKNIGLYEKTCNWMFVAALVTITKIMKNTNVYKLKDKQM